jgi:molybdenum cofactor synthesis domain-containing protein
VTATGLLSVEDARSAVLEGIGGPVEIERIETSVGLRRVVAREVRAATDLPPWDNSAMDGYAVRSADTVGATEDGPITLRVVGEVAAGEAPTTVVEPGAAVRIATGAPIPPGADAVVPVELTTPLDAAGSSSGPRGRDAAGPLAAGCLVHVAVEPGASIRHRGDDLMEGAVLVEPGVEMTPALVALVAGAGVGSIEAHRRPRVAVLATGNEVRTAGQPLGLAGIPDANGPGLAALASDAGADINRLGVASDDLADVTARLRSVIEAVDLAVVSGGVSVGPYDVVRTAFAELGSVELWRVAVQPGKPFAFGLAVRPGRRPVPLFGLPGNPVSTFVTFELFVRPAIRRLAGLHALFRPVDRCTLSEGVAKSHGRRAFLRVVTLRDESGVPVRDEAGNVRARLAGGQGSHVLSALALADGLAEIPEAAPAAEPGIAYPLWWLDR